MKINDLPHQTQKALMQGECLCPRRHGMRLRGKKCSYCRALRLVRDLANIENGGSPSERVHAIWCDRRRSMRARGQMVVSC